MYNYFLPILIAFDRMINAIINGSANETLSSVSFRKHRDGERWGFLCPVINTLFCDPNHCANAYLHDRSVVLPT